MTTAEHRFGYTPDHASPPGDHIQEYVEMLEISGRELARRCGRSGKLIAEIIAGKAPVEPETAIQLERVLGISAATLLNMESSYQLHRAREQEDATLADSHAWASSFPLKDLAARGYLEKTPSKSQQVKELLKFFGVGNVKACEERVEELLCADYRTSSAFTNDNLALASWLRIGELHAEKVETADYDRDKFLQALKELRDLTTAPINEALREIKDKLAAAGVVFLLEPPLSKVRASGVSRWLTPRKALIQQSLRHMSNDHFWFTFFHECAHLLLHSRKAIFVDMAKGPGSADPKQEAEANVWAADFLVPSTQLRTFILGFGGTADEVRAFSTRCRVAPGIVVGQLQHNHVIGFGGQLNKLREFYEWVDKIET
jgi:addiction module HigA family antidote